MPFWLHEHRLMLVCKGQPLRYKITAMGIVLGVLGFGWFIGVFTPWQNDLDQKQRAHAVLVEQKKIFEPAVANYHTCCQKHEQLTQKHKELSEARSQQKITSNLLALMQKNKISCSGIQHGKSIDKGFYQHNEITFFCKGEYQCFLSFLKILDDEKYPIECRIVHFHKNKNKPLACKLHVRVISAKEESV